LNSTTGAGICWLSVTLSTRSATGTGGGVGSVADQNVGLLAA
jgi:hypothetical protein